MKVYYTTEEGGIYKKLNDAVFVVIVNDDNEIVSNYDGILRKPRDINGKYFTTGILSFIKECGVAKRSLFYIVAREKWIAFTHGLRHVLFQIKKVVLKPLSWIWIKFGRHGEDYAHGDCYGFMWFYHLPCCMIWSFYYRDFYCFIPKKHVLFFNGSNDDSKSFSFRNIFHSYSCDGFYWFKLFGYGLHFTDMRMHSLLFSQRIGRSKSLQLGRWNIRILKPKKH